MSSDTENALAAVKGHLRAATLTDLSVIMHHRRQMFEDMGYRDEESLRAMEATSTQFFRTALENGSYRGWLVETTSGVVAGGGVLSLAFPSSPRDASPRRAFIINVYTEPAFRKQGLAKLVMEEMIHWCKEQGYAWVALHASDAGRHLYESLGFKPTNEMRLAL